MVESSNMCVRFSLQRILFNIFKKIQIYKKGSPQKLKFSHQAKCLKLCSAKKTQYKVGKRFSIPENPPLTSEIKKSKKTNLKPS
jgi:hypothetical protein